MRSIGTLVLWLAILGFAGYHLMNGSRSWFAQKQYGIEQANLAAELETVLAQNARLQSKIDGLRAATLDPDLLSERLHSFSVLLPGESFLYGSN